MTAPNHTTIESTPQLRRWGVLRRPKVLLTILLTPLFLGIGYETHYRLLGANLHEVEPGQVYRCAQLSGPTLTKIVRQNGIRTVINLRGVCDPWPWYWEESRTTHSLDICQEDVTMSAGRMPSVTELRRLVEIIDRAEPPLLLHCRRGSDRTGLASTIVRLLRSGDDLATARQQLGPRYAHLRIGRTGNLDRFIDCYVEWLEERELTHTPALFRHWLVDEYRPDECWAQLELLKAPAKLTRGATGSVRVRCTNASTKPWNLRAGTTAGVHARYILRDPDQVFLTSVRGGLFNATVGTGEHIDLTLAIPPLGRAGKYSLFVDMVDEQHGWFYQMGSEPLVVDLEVE